MSEEFKAIETQEALDAIIKNRLERNTKSVTDSVTAEITKKFEGYVSPDDAKKSADQITALTEKLRESETKIAELTAKNSAYEISSVKMKIAQETGLPIELAERLSGNTEEELRKDAELLAKFAAPQHQQHRFSSERSEAISGVEQAFYAKNPELKK